VCRVAPRQYSTLLGGRGKHAGRDVRDEPAVVLSDLKLPTVLKEPPSAPRYTP
jgi:hypothetical protein